MNIKRLVDTVVAGTGMGLIHSAVKIKDGKLAWNRNGLDSQCSKNQGWWCDDRSPY